MNEHSALAVPEAPTAVAPPPTYSFPEPEPLSFSADEQAEIVATVLNLYRREVEQRKTWAADHEKYDAMHRGHYSHRANLPWKGAADLHVQMPFWLVDSINTRQVQGIFGQNPLVGGEATEDDDEEAFRNAAAFVKWSFEQCDARAKWSAVSKTRNIHGVGVGELNYVRAEHVYRQEVREGLPGIERGDSGLEPTFPKKTVLKREVRFEGPIIVPLGYDDVVCPINGENLQPCTVDNPHGADFVIVRQMESLSLLWKKREKIYTAIQTGEFDTKESWIDSAPSQDRSTGASDNARRSRQHDRHEGRQRSQVTTRTPEARPNPEFEILKAYLPWEVKADNGNEEQECIIFVSVKPEVFLGAFRLTDAVYTGRRPFLELHYHKVPGRYYSMGVMEIGKHLSAELDTIHNMRIDVGFATNLPFFFYRAASSFNPDEIELKPLKGVPVDDINDVRFPQLQNVTTFYHQEEQLLYSLIERVFGVTDLFLGISPTQGAAARHATGFVGTQQEALSRMSEILAQDAEEFSKACHLAYEMEVQFGPPERIVRLQGKDGPAFKKVSREQLKMRGAYDFRLGANAGTFSAYLQQQRATAILQLAATSPFINGDMGRRWEAEANYLYSIGESSPEKYIGPKDAVDPATPKTQAEENGEMVQMVYGPGVPAPVHPNDNDMQHLQEGIAFTSAPEYASLSFPNYPAFMAHAQLHQRQQQRKAMMAQQQAMMAQTAPSGMMQQSSGPALGQERIEPQLKGRGNMGAMGDVNQASGPGAGAPGYAPSNGRPQLPSFPAGMR